MKSKTLWAAAGRALAAMTVVLIAVLTLTPTARAAAQFKLLYTFSYGGNGGEPQAGVVFDTQGNLYGTTYWGGDYGSGTVYKLTPNADGTWTENVLFSFSGSAGEWPSARPLLGAAGNIYAATRIGGNHGCGVVFQLTQGSDGTWSESILHDFTGGADGCELYEGTLVSGANGVLYGATSLGGRYGCGTVFALAPAGSQWKFRVIHTFAGKPSCSSFGGLASDAVGNLYGTTVAGGPNNAGTVFRLAPNGSGGWTYKVLYVFKGGKDGAELRSTVTADGEGNLYGATSSGGNLNCTFFNPGCGTVYKLTPTSRRYWKKTTLHRFNGSDGMGPRTTLVFDASGNLYGGACNGGVSGAGVVYRMTPNADGTWKFEIVYQFTGGADGAVPLNGPVFDASGNLYATANYAGDSGAGTAYEITP